MTGTTFCDSTGISALLLAHERAAHNGTELRLLRPLRTVARVLEMTGADQVLMVCESLEESPLL